jgi:hypothetical protein
MSVRRAQREISSAEFSEWMAYDLIDPIGERRADIRAGIIAAAVANTRRRKKSDPVAKPETYMPKFYEPPAEPPSPEEMFEKLKALNELFGGTFVGTD